MKYTISKSVSNLMALRAALLDNGFPDAAIISTVDSVDVHVADGDPTNFVTNWVEPPAISAISDHPMGPFMHYQGDADGVDTQTVTIQMAGWNGNVLIQPLSPIAIDTNTVAVKDGEGTFVVGPTELPGEYDFYMIIQGDNTGYSRYRFHLSFF